MSALGLHFYESNASRNYPLDDRASARSVAGAALPPPVLVDLSLRYPVALGEHPFLAALCVTPNLVSLTIQAATDPDDPATYTAVAVFSAARTTVEPYRHYPLAAQAGGVGGWVVFGPGVADPKAETFSGRFAGPSAGRLAPRAARPYRPLPVKSLGSLYVAAGLDGVVDLIAEPPVEIVAEERTVAGVLRTVAVVRLVQPPAAAGADPAAQPNVFAQYAGPCGRPESGNCGEPEPVQFLNGVGPDCAGNLTIEFVGFVEITPTADGHGVVLDSALSLADLCAPKKLPAADGSLPTDYADACDESETAGESIGAGTLPAAGGPGNYYSDVSESLHAGTGALPYSETFEANTAAGFRVVSGQFDFVGDGAGRSFSTQTARGRVQRNLAVWEGGDLFSIGRRVATRLKVIRSGASADGGLVLNWRPAPDFTGRYVFHAVRIDVLEQTFSVDYFNGTRLLPTAAAATVPGLVLDHWYKLEAVTAAAGGRNVTVTARLYDGQGAGALLSTIVLTTARFYPDVGRFGLYSDRSFVDFSEFRVLET